MNRGFAARLTALIGGRTTASTWDFADGNTATNEPYTFHAWSAPGDYAVVLRAFNESYPGGVSAIVVIHVIAPSVYYVSPASATPMAPFSSWTTAATNIQDAIDVSAANDFIVVSNGNYNVGGRAVYGLATNRVTVDRPLTVQSVNGPRLTIIDGGGAVRCAYLTNGVFFSGFTLTNGNCPGGMDACLC